MIVHLYPVRLQCYKCYTSLCLKVFKNMKVVFSVFVCLFVWGFSSHSKIIHSSGNVIIIANFDLCSWPFYVSVPHLLWHGPTLKIFNGHLRGRAYCRAFDSDLPLHVLTTMVYRGWDSNTQPSACGRTLQPTAPPLQFFFVKSGFQL